MEYIVSFSAAYLLELALLLVTAMTIQIGHDVYKNITDKETH